MNEEYANIQKSYSLDPFPVPDCQMKKRITENFRKRKHENSDEPLKTIDCNGGIASRVQRSDHIPLLVNTKRWHSLELDTVRADADHEESSGCEELIESKKSLGRNFLKSIAGFFNGSNAKNSTQNINGGGGGLLQQPSSAISRRKTNDKESINMSIV